MSASSSSAARSKRASTSCSWRRGVTWKRGRCRCASQVRGRSVFFGGGLPFEGAQSHGPRSRRAQVHIRAQRAEYHGGDVEPRPGELHLDVLLFSQRQVRPPRSPSGQRPSAFPLKRSPSVTSCESDPSWTEIPDASGTDSGVSCKKKIRAVLSRRQANGRYFKFCLTNSVGSWCDTVHVLKQEPQLVQASIGGKMGFIYQ